MNDWYPSQDAKLAAFLSNYVAEIDAATATLGLAPGTFKASKDAAQKWGDANEARDEAEKNYQRALKEFQEQIPLTEKAIRAAAKQIKGTVDVPEQVLAVLELTAPSDNPRNRVAAQMPVLTAAVHLGVVELRYKKLGHQGVRVYGCRTGETDFALLGTYTLNTFTDPRPNRVPNQPEQREYYAVYVDKDQAVGQQSATVSVVVGSRPG